MVRTLHIRLFQEPHHYCESLRLMSKDYPILAILLLINIMYNITRNITTDFITLNWMAQIIFLVL